LYFPRGGLFGSGQPAALYPQVLAQAFDAVAACKAAVKAALARVMGFAAIAAVKFNKVLQPAVGNFAAVIGDSLAHVILPGLMVWCLLAA
jgi:hypothetical protein